jgi:hypothetical protein
LNALCGCWPTTLFIIKDDVVGRSGGDAVSRPPYMPIDLRQSAKFFVALLSNLVRIISFYLFLSKERIQEERTNPKTLTVKVTTKYFSDKSAKKITLFADISSHCTDVTWNFLLATKFVRITVRGLRSSNFGIFLKKQFTYLS